MTDTRTTVQQAIAEKFTEFLREEGARGRARDFADDLIARLAETGWTITPATAESHPGPCDSALLPLGAGPVEPCTKKDGHDDLHQNAQGVRWSDPTDEEG